MRLVWATVRAIDDPGTAVQRLRVELDDGTSGDAVNYTVLAGACHVGDRVLLNTTAVTLSLGTGGVHFVVSRGGDALGVALDAPSGGHVMKLRYTPLQLDVVAVEADESPHHRTMAGARELGGMPVVCCGLHSHVPLVAAAFKERRPDARVAYCMTDEAALCLGLSEIMAASVETSLVDTTITCGQAFGGSLEAVNIYSGLLAARHVANADVAIVALGPGVVGTGTPYGHGGVAQGQAINAAASLAGAPVACLRVSFSDSRERHRGVSHHTLTALASVARANAIVALPHLDDDQSHAIEASLAEAGIWATHTRATPRIRRISQPDMRGVRVTTMGRGPREDPAFYEAAFAAGDIASDLT